MFTPRKQKKYWEMSPLEKQIKYKDLTPQERLQLHRQEMRNFAKEQIQKKNEVNNQAKLEKEMIKAIEE